jgi:transposase
VDKTTINAEAEIDAAVESEDTLLTKTLTFGLGNPSSFNAQTEALVTLTDTQRQAVYNGLRDASTVVARVINLLNGREYVRRIMEIPKEVVDQFKPNYSLVKGPLKRLGIAEIDHVAGSVLSQTFALGVKPDFQGEHGKSLMLKGERQIPLHKTDGTHPIPQRAAETRLFKAEKTVYLAMQVFAATWAKERELPSGWLAFPVKVKPRDKTMLGQLLKTIAGEWKLKNSRIMRSHRTGGNKWLGQIVVAYHPEPFKALSKNVVMGIDLGVNVPACLHIRENGKPLLWAMMVGRGRDMLNTRNLIRVEIVRIIRALRSKDSPLDGKARAIYLEKLRDLRKREKRTMKTASQTVAARIADTAKRQGAGVWQMEDLSPNLKEDQPWLARNWAPGMLLDAVRWQAKQAGAELVLVNPAHTSRRCSECGHIAAENRPKGKAGASSFLCVKCGRKDDADKNAARNLSVLGIAELIETALAPNGAAQ